jgi:hypothetical protein
MGIRKHARRFWRSSIIIGTLAAIAMAIPTTASAIVAPPCSYPGACQSIPSYVHPWAGYKGWGVVKTYYCAPGMLCPMYPTAAYAPAWRWNGAWNRAYVANETPVYVYPYAVGWSWIWTANTGWLAMSDSYVYVRKLEPPVYPV